MPAGMLGTLLALWDVVPLFSNTGWGQNSNIAFLESHMGVEFTKRQQRLSNITAADLKSGDFLAMSKIRGRWGAFETLEKWVTGAQAGHTAVCLRDEDDKLWVGESGHENEAVKSLPLPSECQNCMKMSSEIFAFALRVSKLHENEAVKFLSLPCECQNRMRMKQ